MLFLDSVFLSDACRLDLEESCSLQYGDGSTEYSEGEGGGLFQCVGSISM